MKAKDLRERSMEDLRDLEKSLAKDTFQNRFKNFTNRLDDTSSIGKARKDLARVLTTITLKSAPAAGEAAAKPAPQASQRAPKAALKTPAKTAAAKKAKVAKPKKTDTSSKKAKEG
jgi:large subunit ribosomal protein L29